MTDFHYSSASSSSDSAPTILLLSSSTLLIPTGDPPRCFRRYPRNLPSTNPRSTTKLPRWTLSDLHPTSTTLGGSRTEKTTTTTPRRPLRRLARTLTRRWRRPRGRGTGIGQGRGRGHQDRGSHRTLTNIRQTTTPARLRRLSQASMTLTTRLQPFTSNGRRQCCRFDIPTIRLNGTTRTGVRMGEADWMDWGWRERRVVEQHRQQLHTDREEMNGGTRRIWTKGTLMEQEIRPG